jgi:hypothetical protein
MIVVNLDKFSEDGFKKPANSINADEPDNITHARFYYDDFTGDNYVQATFVEGNNSTVEADVSAVPFLKFKLFTSQDGISYTERKTYGGTDGFDVANNTLALDPADYADNDLIIKTTIGDVEQFVPKPLSEIAGSGSGVDYLYCRGRLVQHNSRESGKAFFGSITIDPDTGNYTNTGTGQPEQTFADSWSATRSFKSSTGVYGLQFLTDLGAGVDNTFVTGINTTPFSYRFETTTYDVWRKLESEYVELDETYIAVKTNEYMGTVVLAIDQEVDAVGLSGTNQGSGVLIIKTYDTDGVLADNILTAGVTIEFRAFLNLA